MIKPLLKGLKVAPFVQCSRCSALVELGTKSCKLCDTALESVEGKPITLVAVNLGSRYTPFIECPNCKRLVEVGIKRCKSCYEEIAEEYAVRSAAAVVFNTVACDVANSLISDSYPLLVVIISTFIYISDIYTNGSPLLFYTCLFFPLPPITLILLWFYRFGTFVLGDAEYEVSKRRLSRKLTVWLAILSAQIIALGTWWV